MTFNEFTEAAQQLAPSTTVFAQVQFVRHCHYGKHLAPTLEFRVSIVSDDHQCRQWQGITPEEALGKMQAALYPVLPTSGATDTESVAQALGTPAL